jgi:very-short-patch-repair endonuclease/predicted transcriptional regulator of viral defense system
LPHARWVSSEPAIDPRIGGKSSARSWDQEIARLAERQYGVVARRQLLELGVGKKAIDGRIQRGRLHEFFRGVYVVGARRIGRKGRWMAAVLAAGEGSVLSHRSAARLWGVMPLATEWIDVICPPGRIVRRRGIVSHESTVAGDERCVVDGIPVTSIFRTIFDLAAVVSLRELERALHEAEVRELRDRVSLPMLLERYPGRRGARNLRAVLGSEEPVGWTRNDFEEAFLALVDAYGLLRPRMNADLALRGRFFEVDALWEEQRVALELDSRGVHGTKKRFESDRQRDRILVAEGWRTMRVTWWQLQDEPEEIATDLSLLLR